MTGKERLLLKYVEERGAPARFHLPLEHSQLQESNPMRTVADLTTIFLGNLIKKAGRAIAEAIRAIFRRIGGRP
jgi:hypothetical protein